MTPKILFTDIDGTLLNKDKVPSLFTKQEIHRLNTVLQVPVILVSARMPKSMRLLQAELGLQNEVIAYNGSLVLGKEDDDVLHDERIPLNITLTIIEKAKQYGLHYSVFAEDVWVANQDDEWVAKELRNTKVVPDTIHESAFEQLAKKGTHKIMVLGDPDKIDIVQQWIAEILANDVTFYRSKNTYLEINPKNSTKLTGVGKVLSVYNLTLADAMAIGDNHNDTEMIQHAGVGVAVDNAHEEIKKAAAFVSASNINDGVAMAIKKYF